ncbi:histidinol dehydrogenase [Thiohalorhabdus methylotrophus]|uniref:Histidinol dehydrogenase n=1 Tax=Thiohalorhabdus methylotrophus TaxID=3242694 RepID=A0ABV4TY19_9GAMM
MNIRRLNSTDSRFSQDLNALLAWEEEADREVESTVRTILDRVRDEGDEAVLQYTQQFDRVEHTTMAALEISRDRMEAALERIPAEQREALEGAAARIRDFHARQKDRGWSYVDDSGTRLGQKVTPLDKVGVYIPGGTAAYPSTVLMNVIPAKVAGVGEIVMTVPTPGGEVHDLVLAAAAVAGVDLAFTIGGAQAVGALAYGTGTVPGVDKIVGPGNRYVATAKRLVFGRVGIDMIAGPSEIVVVSDGGTDPDWLAMDLLSQAEHDEHAQAILITPDAQSLEKVADSLRSLVETLNRAEIARRSLEGRGALIQVADLREAVQVANRIAPEHLELSVAEPDALLEEVRHAGAVFLGAHTAEVMGDYVAGPNHVLPTEGTARFSSPLGVYDFQKRTSLIGCSGDSAKELGRMASVLARAEGLTAHAHSADYRVRAGKQEKGE